MATTEAQTVGTSIAWAHTPEEMKTKIIDSLLKGFRGIASDVHGCYYGPLAVQEAQGFINNPETIPLHKITYLLQTAWTFQNGGFAAVVGNIGNQRMDYILQRVYTARLMNPALRLFIINPLNFSAELLTDPRITRVMGVYSRYGRTPERRILYGYIELPHIVGTKATAPVSRAPYGFNDNCGAGYAIFKKEAPRDYSTKLYGPNFNLLGFYDCEIPTEFGVEKNWLVKKAWSGSVVGKEMQIYFFGNKQHLWEIEEPK